MKQKRYMLLVSIFLLVLIILFAGVSGMRNPEKTEVAAKVSEPLIQTEKIRNADYEIQEMNPLVPDKEKHVTEAVNQYLIDRAEQKDYIDYYKNVKVYMKDGPYAETYVVFTRYDMKIKGIYTEVPGLDTYYVSKENDGSWKLTENLEAEEEQKAVQEVAKHSDVEKLVEETQSAYESAVASDAILRESLTDLENALN